MLCTNKEYTAAWKPLNDTEKLVHMLTAIHPKLPMRDREVTRKFYTELLGFRELGRTDYAEYLMVERDNVQLHFFLFPDLDPRENYGQVYFRTDDIDQLYQSFLEQGIPIHPAGHLQEKPWGQKEFSVLDPDTNLLTFGQGV